MAIHFPYFPQKSSQIHYNLLTSPATAIFWNQVLYYPAYQDLIKIFYFGFHFNISFFFLFFSIVLHLQSHVFCWQIHVNSVIVVILSTVQTIHNSKDKACFICEWAKCVLPKLLNKILTETIFDFLFRRCICVTRIRRLDFFWNC